MMGAGTPSEPSSKPFLKTFISRLTAIINARVPSVDCCTKKWSAGSTSSSHTSKGKTSDTTWADDEDEPPFCVSPPATASYSGGGDEMASTLIALSSSGRMMSSSSGSGSSRASAHSSPSLFSSRAESALQSTASSSTATPSSLSSSSDSAASPPSPLLCEPSPSSTMVMLRTSCQAALRSRSITLAVPSLASSKTRPAHWPSSESGKRTASPRRTSTSGCSVSSKTLTSSLSAVEVAPGSGIHCTSAVRDCKLTLVTTPKGAMERAVEMASAGRICSTASA
mmetsp:Transcript_61639/g.177425  ORF Transcript_61639/g.177425 Transcript_61639/m.177425 type:complete len:282 (+) Transcript_61639:700-1545(+)